MFHAIGQCEVLSPHTVNFTVILACSDFHLRRLIQTNNYRSKKGKQKFFLPRVLKCSQSVNNFHPKNYSSSHEISMCSLRINCNYLKQKKFRLFRFDEGAHDGEKRLFIIIKILNVSESIILPLLSWRKRNYVFGVWRSRFGLI